LEPAAKSSFQIFPQPDAIGLPPCVPPRHNTKLRGGSLRGIRIRNHSV